MLTDTIAAIATAPGEAGVAIIRVSGSQVLAIWRCLFRTVQDQPLLDPVPRYAYFGKIVDEKGKLIDTVLAFYMQAPHSFTGEDIMEIHCHGGFMAPMLILKALYAAGAVSPEPGEFSQRAFINGKMDLTQAEAIADIIQAKSAAALSIAQKQLAGKLGKAVAEQADLLLDLLAAIEVAVDYPEEETDIWQNMGFTEKLGTALAEVNRLLAAAAEGKLYREGIKTAIIGPANAGKSTLLNAFLEEDRAIVTNIAGTTRDTIEEYYTVSGVLFKLIDTAGIRQSHDPVETRGISRSLAAMQEADLLLAVFDASAELPQGWQELLAKVADKPIIILLNKQDKAPNHDLAQVLKAVCPKADILPISAAHGRGINELKELLLAKFSNREVNADDLQGMVNERPKAALAKAKSHLEAAINGYEAGIEGDMLSIDIQAAWQALAEITGAVSSDDIITRVFSRFCLGK